MAQTDKAGQLIARIDAAADAGIARIDAEAAAAAAATMRAAHARSRARVAREIADLRRDRDRALMFERARIDTERRHMLHVAHSDTIGAILPLLADALRALWQDAATRRSWIAAAAAEAAARLDPGGWRVEHPPHLPAPDREALRRTVAAAAGGVPELAEDPALAAGLRIRSGAAWLDATAEALLCDPQDVGARLLAALAAAEAPP